MHMAALREAHHKGAEHCGKSLPAWPRRPYAHDTLWRMTWRQRGST